MTAREAILGAARVAGGAPAAPRAYRITGTLTLAERVALFEERLVDYRAEVRRLAPTDVAATVAAVAASRGATVLGVPPALPQQWRPTLDLRADDGLSPADLDALDGALTGCTVAIAETGTIVLAAGPADGRRALSLVPDLHICVAREEQVVELVPEALARLEAEGLTRRPLTFVSGPSATSDIGFSRVEGVHGPRDLVVLLVSEA